MIRRLYLLLVLVCIGVTAQAQLVVNEFSQGQNNVKEYIELVVVGNRTCTDSTADLRGWIVDDNSGWYGTAGIATGHVRFKNVANWAAVPYGSVILLYNAADKNTSISLADDITDANHDYVYVVPVSTSDTYLETNDNDPSTPASATYFYPAASSTANYASANNTWTVLGLANGGDAILTVSPTVRTTAFHSVVFGTMTGGSQTPSVTLGTVGPQNNAYLTNAAYNSSASWTVGNAGATGNTETPGAGNTAANSSWISSMRVQAVPPAPSTISASICAGQNYFFGNTNRNTAGSYTYTFTSRGCDSVVTLNLTVNPQPAISGITPANPTCAGNNGSLVINGLTANTVYTVGYTRGGTPVTGLTLTSNGAGVVTIANLGSGIYTDITVAIGTCSTINNGPYVLSNTGTPAQPVPTSNSPICEGATLNLTTSAVAGATYQWNGPNSFTSTAQNPTIPNTTPAATGTYSVTVTVAGCSSPAGTVGVTVNALPARPAATSGSPFCEGNTITLFASTVPGAGYTWTGPSYTANSQNALRVNATVAMSGYYRVTATVGTCTSLPDSVLVTVNPRPAAPTITGNSPVCTGDTIKLAVSSPVGGTTYTWNGPASYTATGNNVNIPATAAAGGTYSVTATANSCASLTAGTYAVTVNPRPVISNAASANPTTCSGTDGSITLSGLTAGTSYTIAYTKNGTPQTATIVASGAGTLVLSGLGAGTYAISGVTASGCTSLPVAPITLSNPAAPAAPAPTSNSPVCEGGTLQLNANGVAGASYVWSGPGFTAGTANPSIANVTLAASGSYTVYQVVNGCNSPGSTISVTINPRPATPVLSGNSPVCTGDTIKLSVNSPVAGVTYTWSGPNAYSATGSNVAIPATTAAAGTYSVTASQNTCNSVGAGTIAVTVNQRPVANGFTLNNPTTCGGTDGSITIYGLTAGTTYSITYTRNGVPQTITGVPANTGGNPLVISGLNAGTYIITGVTAPNGCTSALLGPIPLSDPAATLPPTASSNTPICAGNTLQLTATGIAGATYTWTGPNSFNATTRNPSIPNATGAAAGTYSVTQTFNGCTSPVATTVVTVNPRPATPVIFSNSPVCTGDTIKLSTTTAVPGVVYAWSGPGFSSGLQNPTIPNATAAANGTYSLTLIAPGDCASLPANLNVTVNARPVITQIVSNSPVCSGGSINLQAVGAGAGSTYAWNGPNAYTAPTQTIQINNVTIGNGGNYTVTAMQNGCSSLPVTTNVVVNPTPAIATVTGTNTSGCGSATGSILLTGLAANTQYNVSYIRNGVPTSVLITSTAGGNVTIAGLAAGTYANIVVTAGNCSSAPAGPVTLTDPAAPATPAPANNGPICSGATLSLSTPAVAGAVYSWSGPAGFTSAAQNPSIPNATTAASGQYRVTVTVGTCVSAPGFTTAAVSQTPATPVAGSNSPVCVGNTLTLTAASATAGATYTWNGPNSFTSTQQNPSIANVTPAAAGTYTVTTQLGTCSAPAVTTTVAVTPIPGAPTPATPLVYCQGIVAPPLSAAGTGLRFYTDSVGGTGVATLSPSTAAAGTFTYYVSQAANGCEGPRAKITVTINPKPAPPVTATSLTYCQFSVAAPLAATGTNVRWYATATGNTPLTAAPTPNTTTPGTFNYYVSQQPADCESDRLQVTVVVNAKPAPPTVQNPLFLCQNDSVQLTANGQNLRWYLHPTGGGGIAHLSPPTGTVDSFTYYVTQTVDGCESDRSRLQVYVNYKPNGIILASRPWLCSGDTISFTYYGNARADAEYNWKLPPYSVAVSGGGAGPYVVRYDSAGRQYVQLTINNMGCLSDVFEQPVEVRSHPDLRFVLQEAGCVDEPVNVALSGITTGIDSYSWDFGGGTILYSTATGGPYGIRWSGAGTKVVTVVATSRTCGSQPYRDTIEIHPNPDARISRVGGGVVCSGDSVELSVENEAGSTYVWSPYQYFTDRARMASTVYATPTLSGKIGVVVTSAKGCTSTDSIYIETKPCCEVYFPNAFSPNGDGKNDVFRAVTAGHHDVATFRVINRWGQVVYESKDERRGWDGTFNGRDQDAGTFYYYVKYRCSESGDYLEQKGEVILMR